MATTTLGSKATGSIIKLKENGKLVEFYVGVHNYESSLNGTGRTLVFRKDCYDQRQWHTSNVNAYASSAIDSWLNSTYKNLLDADIRGVIGTTKIKYTPGNGNTADGRKVKGTIHWVSAAHCVDAEVRLYDKLFTEANMNGIPEGSDYKDYLNPESVTVRTGCKLEESLKDAKPGEKFQFVRTGFFTPDSKNPGVYNRVVTLRDSFKPAK